MDYWETAGAPRVIMDKCSKCKNIKESNLFVAEEWKKENRRALCIECFWQIRKKISDKRKARLSTAHGKKNWDEYISRRRTYRHSEEGRIKERQYRENRKEKQKEYECKYYKDNKERLKCKSLEWSKRNPEKKKIYRKNQNNKRRLNPIHNFHDRIRKRLIRVLNDIGLKKNSRTQDILGYSAIELFWHLNQYIDKPCDDCKLVIINRQTCCIDHLYPIGSAETIADVISLNQLNNLRLICRQCNLAKIKYDLVIIRALIKRR